MSKSSSSSSVSSGLGFRAALAITISWSVNKSRINNMKPEERMEAWKSIKGDKPTWETFKRLLASSDNDVEKALKKWKKKH